MAKRIQLTGAKPRGIEIVDQPKRRVDPTSLAAALGANPIGENAAGNLDLVALGELGTQLLHRLRSSGGRPALVDATVTCRVPLSAEDIKTLETIVTTIGESNAAKPSVGQLVSVIVHRYLADIAPRGDTGIDLRATTSGAEVVLTVWRNLFPNVPDLQTVATRATFVAERELPLMMADAA